MVGRLLRDRASDAHSTHVAPVRRGFCGVSVSPERPAITRTGHRRFLAALTDLSGATGQWAAAVWRRERRRLGFARALTELSESLGASAEMGPEAKNEALEFLSLLASEATALREKRRGKAMLAVLAKLSGIIGGTNALAGLW